MLWRICKLGARTDWSIIELTSKISLTDGPSMIGKADFVQKVEKKIYKKEIPLHICIEIPILHWFPSGGD